MIHRGTERALAEAIARNELYRSFGASDQRAVERELRRYPKLWATRPGDLGASITAVIAKVASVTNVLDNISAAPVAAFSLAHKLKSTYSGNAFAVRKAADGAGVVSNIGFSGDLTNEAACESYCGAGHGYAESAFDQTGNGFTLTQSDASHQPKIHDTSAGMLHSPGSGGLCGYWDSARNDRLSRSTAFGLTGNAAFTVYIDGDVDATSGDFALFSLGGGPDLEFYSGSVILVYDPNSGGYRIFGTTDQYEPSYWTITHAAAANMNAVVLYRNGSSASETDSASGNPNFSNDEAVWGHLNSPFNGWMGTKIVWDVVLGTTDLTALHLWASTHSL